MKFFAFVLLFLSPFCFSSSLDELTAKAQSNDADAQYQLALRYLSGSGVDISTAEARYWLEQSATSGKQEAALALADFYLTEISDDAKVNKAVYWLTTLAVSGNVHAQEQLGAVYEQRDQLNLAKTWYQVAAKNSELAQQGYERVLEKQFNAQRAKQVSSIDQLEETLDPAEIEIKPASQFTPKHEEQTFVYLSALLGALLLISLVWHKMVIVKASRKASESTSQSHQESLALKEKLKSRETTIKQQKRQLDILYRQFKKLQASQEPAKMSPAPDNKVAIACALFGYRPSALPESKEIKIRYKQLSKIYHPDKQGSEEEMKRLNNALKVVLNVVNH